MAAIKQDHLFQRRMIFVYRPKMSYVYEITSRSAPRQTTHCKASGMLSPSGLGPLHEKMLDCLLYGWWSPWIKWFKIVYFKVDGFLGLNDFGRSDHMVPRWSMDSYLATRSSLMASTCLWFLCPASSSLLRIKSIWTPLSISMFWPLLVKLPGSHTGNEQTNATKNSQTHLDLKKIESDHFGRILPLAQSCCPQPLW